MEKRELEVGEIVQIGPNAVNPMFSYCFMTVTESKSWGAQGFVQSLGEYGKSGGQAYYRATFDVMEPTGGKAAWIPE
jgi:hypothetical protein